VRIVHVDMSSPCVTQQVCNSCCITPPATAGVAAEDVYAVFNGKPLADAELLSLAGVEEEQTLYILGRWGNRWFCLHL
jgi:hypothetical protein